MGNQGFRGTLKSKHYFEGWYLKQVSGDRSSVYAFIPGVSLNKENSHAFIQVINGITGKTQYITYPLSQFQAKKERFDVTIGDSHFSPNGISLNITQGDFSCHGELRYKNTTPFPSTLFAPDIMGWYSYVPFMECFHDLVSMHHEVSGALQINDREIDFSGGEGYIEKDRGKSFPQCWIWLQCNSFSDNNTSLMLSIARIPFLGMSFAGFLGFIYVNGETIPFATWNGARITSIERTGKKLNITISRGKYRLELYVTQNRAGELIAPIAGGLMERRIKESIDSEVSYTLYLSDTLYHQGSGTHAGLEVIESIFDYLPKAGVTVQNA